MKSILQLFADYSSSDAAVPQGASGLLLSLLITLLLSACMMLVYRFCHDDLTYRRKFNVTLMMLALVSSLLLAIIQNNPLFSLGALSALSICRIRTNTKDPRDLGFVFWALMIGTASAMGAYLTGLAGTLLLGIVMIVLHKTEKTQKYTAIVVRGDKDSLAPVRELLHETPGSRLQSQNLRSDSFELVYELRERNMEAQALMQGLGNIEGVQDINILAPNTQVA